MKLKTLLSVLLVYRSNFHVLHWMAEGENFFTIHSKSAEYYDMLLSDADVVAEMILRRDGEIVNYAEALDTIEKCDKTFLLVESKEHYDTDRFKENACKMFKDILSCIEEILNSEDCSDAKNVGIKSSLEGMYDKYDLQCNYLLKRL